MMQYRELTRNHPFFLGVERMVAVKQVGGRSALRPRERGARHSPTFTLRRNSITTHSEARIVFGCQQAHAR